MLVRSAIRVRVPPARLNVRAKHTSAATLLDPVLWHVISFPEYTGLVHAGLPCPYLLSIVGFTVLLRSAVSLPLLSWQHARSERLSKVVLPEWSVWKRQIPASVWTRLSPSRKVGPEMQRHIQRQIRRSLHEKWDHLTQLYNCSPLKTTLVSLSVHLPIFITVTMMLRQGAYLPDSPFFTETVPWWTPDADFVSRMSTQCDLLASKGLAPDLIDKLTKVKGPTLADRDTTMVLPILLGAINMLNVEISTFIRQRRTKREDAIGLGNTTHSDPVVDQLETELKEPLFSRMLNTALRLGAIASIPIASQVPNVRISVTNQALIVYWLTSSTFSLGQNVIRERREAQK